MTALLRKAVIIPGPCRSCVVNRGAVGTLHALAAMIQGPLPLTQGPRSQTGQGLASRCPNGIATSSNPGTSGTGPGAFGVRSEIRIRALMRACSRCCFWGAVEATGGISVTGQGGARLRDVGWGPLWGVGYGSRVRARVPLVRAPG